jgi:hypothetical protein
MLLLNYTREECHQLLISLIVLLALAQRREELLLNRLRMAKFCMLNNNTNQSIPTVQAGWLKINTNLL